MKKAIEQYNAAAKAYFAAREAEEKASREYRTAPRGSLKDPGTLEELKAAATAHHAAAEAERRALRIKHAAAHIAEKKAEAAAVPVILDVLKKYAGKPAGPKTREKAGAEIAAALGVSRAYFSGGFYGDSLSEVTLVIDGPGYYEVKPCIRTRYPEKFVDAENRFQVPTLEAPDVSTLPADLDAWADEFEQAAAELEEAKKAFEAAASRARRVNLGNAVLENYHIRR